MFPLLSALFHDLFFLIPVNSEIWAGQDNIWNQFCTFLFFGTLRGRGGFGGRQQALGVYVLIYASEVSGRALWVSQFDLLLPTVNLKVNDLSPPYSRKGRYVF
jgi:hypothetical protein